ncbi:MAG: TetR/AcrR family transcriptional regulator [Firmicutes bacterium]|nr:TetR/AcrR family transcriptional regulator [Bacillota bacterium]
MEDSWYPQKRKAVYDGVIALMEKGLNPYTIKVSDIASEADIGKGTLYDYFSSKEEAISRAILYYIKIGLEHTFTRVKDQSKFKNKFHEILHVIAEQVDSNISIFRILLSVGATQEFYGYLSEYRGELLAHLSKIHEIYDHLAKCGVREGAIRDGRDPYYRDMVITGAILGFSQYFGERYFNPAVNMERAMAAAYTILLKALN